MSAAVNRLVLMVLALAACGETTREAEANNAAVTDIEALPPDESVATPTDELANGAIDLSNGDSAQD